MALPMHSNISTRVHRPGRCAYIRTYASRSALASLRACIGVHADVHAFARMYRQQLPNEKLMFLTRVHGSCQADAHTFARMHVYACMCMHVCATGATRCTCRPAIPPRSPHRSCSTSTAKAAPGLRPTKHTTRSASSTISSRCNPKPYTLHPTP